MLRNVEASVAAMGPTGVAFQIHQTVIAFHSTKVSSAQPNMPHHERREQSRPSLSQRNGTKGTSSVGPVRPIVTVMGPVAQGKTSLLDNIRKTNVIEGEAGGITQHIGAYSVVLNGQKITFLDTPGHEDFAEDTYRTLTAVDSVIIVIDGAKGVEAQTRKLMEVCRMRSTPVIVFVNKLDRPSKEPFDLLDEVEKELRIRVRPLAFPISNGPTFKGVYNLYEKNLSLFTSDEKLTADASTVEISDLSSAELDARIGEQYADQLRSDVELVEGVYDPFDRDAYLRGELAPVFFGSAVNNFGVRELLECFIRIAPSPRPAPTETRTVEPSEPKMTGFVFKIHANMDPNHRDRIAFLKICSGIFERNKNYLHVRSGKQLKFSSPTAFMAEKKSVIDFAYPGVSWVCTTRATSKSATLSPRARNSSSRAFPPSPRSSSATSRMPTR